MHREEAPAALIRPLLQMGAQLVDSHARPSSISRYAFTLHGHLAYGAAFHCCVVETAKARTLQYIVHDGFTDPSVC